MERYKVCIINCYFGGNLPNNLNLFLDSCRKNDEYNWLLVTDKKLGSLPNNVRNINMSLHKFKKIIENKLGFKIALSTPYKCCDYKIAYGLIFQEYLEGYDYWGYGDFDVIYGDLSKFLSQKITLDYDKIYPLGHFSILKNNIDMINAFKLETVDSYSYKTVFTSEKIFGIDEHGGINEKLIRNGFKVYGGMDFADISLIYKGMKCVDERTLKIVNNFSFAHEAKNNYKNQMFYILNGKVFRAYYLNNKIKCEEFSYIHYRIKIKDNREKNEDSYIISPLYGFVNISQNYSITKNSINKYNPKNTKLYEELQFIKYQIKYRRGK